MTQELTPEQVVEAAQALIGIETEPINARYPIEYEPIRRFCHAAWDDNPLFTDPEYARQTPYGEVVCPPLALRAVASFPGGPLDSPFPPLDRELPVLPDLPGGRGLTVNLGVEWEFFEPVLVGDHISETSRYAAVYLKATRADPQSIFFVIERIYRNQRGQVVAISRTTSMRHRTPEQIAAAGATS